MTSDPGSAATTNSVVIVDDHPLFRRGLADLLGDDDVTVLAEAGTVEDGLAAVEAHNPDVVIMDLHLPDGSGVTAIRHLTSAQPDVRVLVLSMDSTDAAVIAALRAGASGYLLKETAAESIGDTVAAMIRGELVIDARLAPRIVGLLTSERTVSSLDGLTTREMEVLELVARGLSNQEVGRKLFLAEKTVRNNITVLLSKTDLATRPALIAFARDRGLGSADLN